VHLQIQEFYLGTETGRGSNRKERINRNQEIDTKRSRGTLMKRPSQKRLPQKIVRRNRRVPTWKGEFGLSVMKELSKNLNAVRELRKASRRLSLLIGIRRKMITLKKKQGETCVRGKK
jgi:hypothetical protein